MDNKYEIFDPNKNYPSSEKFINSFNAINKELFLVGYEIGLNHINGGTRYVVSRITCKTRKSGVIPHVYDSYSDALNDVYSRLNADAKCVNAVLNFIKEELEC